MKKVGNWLWGLVLVAIGVIWGLNALEITSINIFFPGWWTLIIIIPCVINLFTDEHKWGSIVGILIGVVLLLGCWDIVSFGLVWKLFFPAVLVLIGLVVIFRNTAKGEAMERIRELKEKWDDEDAKPELEEYWSTFGEQKVDYQGKEFRGCRLDSVFGGIELDLRGAKVKEDVIVRASSVFGGMTIYVPEHVRVEVVSTAIFGGVDDKRKKSERAEKIAEAEVVEDAGAKKGDAGASGDKAAGSKTAGTTKKNDGMNTLYIDATCVFGGIEIR